jgi:flagellar hook-basal body complex protein FliE
MDVVSPVVRIESQALAESIIEPARPAGESEAGQGVGFAHSLEQAIHGADDKERLADEKMAAVDSGSSDDLVGAMLASQDASLSFSMLMQVRNKVVGAMDDLLKLQL